MAVPRATYRVQLHAGFTFNQASDIAAYLAALGISHIYTSPCLQAAPGSTHGYDVVDFNAVNGELGGDKGLETLWETLAVQGLGQVVDIVPNHMAASHPHNTWWRDLLRNGPSSRYASYFDVYWREATGRRGGKLLLPLLGGHYGEELRKGGISLVRRGEEIKASYFDHALPLSWRSLAEPLHHASAKAGIGPPPPVPEVKSSTTAVRKQVGGTPRSDMGAWESGMGEWFREALKVEAFVREIGNWLDGLNSDPVQLDRFLEQQHYRLVYWRTSENILGYRRFFDINGLVALRAEKEDVFEHTHRLVLQWIWEQKVDGLRVDHPDGLRDPFRYFSRLREAAPEAWIVAEKILVPGENLSQHWPVQGTTGYDFLNQLNTLFVAPEGEEPLTALYREFTGEVQDFSEVLRESKRYVVQRVLGGDLNRLVEILAPVCNRHIRSRDFTRPRLAEALTELLACFPVYRTYIEDECVAEEDRKSILEAAAGAKKRSDPEVVEYLASLLLGEVDDAGALEFAARFQQLSGPAMAKGGEDTALYRYFRLISLNEVGGDPERFGMTVEEFHRLMKVRSLNYPASMLSTSTHDTKRSEDVRARLNLLSEIHDSWRDAVLRWSSMNEKHRSTGIPDRNTEYLLYQTLVGVWPIERKRLVPYMRKAAREAKIHTSWTDPNDGYEKSLEKFITALYRDTAFLKDLEGFVAPLIYPGRVNSLAQTLVKLTAPGVPDLYQGTELWDLSLVDPDNRRLVDYKIRKAMIRELDTSSTSTLEGGGLVAAGRDILHKIQSRMDEGMPKLWIIRQALSLRKHHPEYFSEGSPYEPVTVTGTRAHHVLCFTRHGRVAVLIPRFPLLLQGDWQDTFLHLSRGTWVDLLSGQVWEGGIMPVSSLLGHFPVALLLLH